MAPFWKRAARMSSEVANMVVMGGCRNASNDSLKNASSRSSCGGRGRKQLGVRTKILRSLGQVGCRRAVAQCDVFRHAYLLQAC
jgi:hypothetical protein